MINRQNLHGKIMKGEILQIGHSLLLWHQQPLHNFGHFILKSSRCFLIESFDAKQDFSFCALQEASEAKKWQFQVIASRYYWQHSGGVVFMYYVSASDFEFCKEWMGRDQKHQTSISTIGTRMQKMFEKGIIIFTPESII